MIKSDPDEVSYTTMTTTEPQSHGRDHLKRKLTLNIGSANNLASIPGIKTGSGSPSVIKRTRAQSKLEVLTTPDLQLLKLGSPEIERLILSQTNNLQTPTPISQYFLNNASPKNVTQEQEIYVKGFQEALSKLHQQNAGIAPSAAEPDSLTISAHDSNNNTDWSSTCSEDSSSMHQTPAAAPATMKRGGGRKNTTRVTNTRSRATTRRQTSTTSSGSSVTNKSSLLNPIDMGSQEKIKLERKRQRNRVAASKCRKRKLERIAKLEVKVNHLKVENGELNTVATKLRDSVNKLKAEIEHHVSMGCNFDHLNNLLQ